MRMVRIRDRTRIVIFQLEKWFWVSERRKIIRGLVEFLHDGAITKVRSIIQRKICLCLL